MKARVVIICAIAAMALSAGDALSTADNAGEALNTIRTKRSSR